MNKSMLIDFKSETGITLFQPKGTKDEFASFRDIYFQVFAGRYKEEFVSKNETNSRKDDLHYFRFVKKNLTEKKLDSGDFYYKEGRDYIVTVTNEGKAHRPKSEYWVNLRTAEKILVTSETEIGSRTLDRLLDYVETKTKFQFSRDDSKFFYRGMTDAIRESHDPVKPYHFSNEANMLNTLVLGMNAKQFKEKYGTENVRDHINPQQIQEITRLEKINTGLLMMGQEYQERKDVLLRHLESFRQTLTLKLQGV